MNKIFSSSLFSLAFMLAAFGDEGKDPNESIAKNLSLTGIDGISITMAPKADFNADDVKQMTLEDKKDIEQWISLLEKIPAKGPGLKVKMVADAKEYTINFYKNKAVVATLRIKGSKLDSPVGSGWDYYINEDDDFINLVEKKI